MLLMIDNYDSFTFNVVQYLGELGADVVTLRNDEIDLATIERLAPEKIVTSSVSPRSLRRPVMMSACPSSLKSATLRVAPQPSHGAPKKL